MYRNFYLIEVFALCLISLSASISATNSTFDHESQSIASSNFSATVVDAPQTAKPEEAGAKFYTHERQFRGTEQVSFYDLSNSPFVQQQQQQQQHHVWPAPSAGLLVSASEESQQQPPALYLSYLGNGLDQVYRPQAMPQRTSTLVEASQSAKPGVGVALGKEDSKSTLSPATATMDYSPPISQLAAQSSDQEQILTNFYLNNPQYLQVQPSDGYAVNQVSSYSYPQNPIGVQLRPSAAYQQFGAYSQNPMMMHQQGAGPSVSAGSTANQAAATQNQSRSKTQQQQTARRRQKVKAAVPPAKMPAGKQKQMLSNDQLVSLIDELKDFNSRQASKIQASSAVSPPDSRRESQVREVEVERDEIERPRAANLKHNHRAKDEAQVEESKFDADDLAKFAKFLMTKEGANMKFQLGLERDSPDDGDEEDDRDALLETRKEPAVARKRGGEALEKRQSDMVNQMDQLIEDAIDRTKEISKRQQKEKEKEKKKKTTRNKLKDDDSSDERELEDRRKRREKSAENSPPANDNEVVSSNQPSDQHDFSSPSNHDENYAKMLIKKELMEDKQDSLLETPENASSLDSVARIAGEQKATTRRKFRRSNEPASSNSQISQTDDGDSKFEYPKSERHKDQNTLLDELYKARLKKSKTRERIPLAVNSVLKRALDGELGLHTERRPDGRLIMRSGNNNDNQAALTLNLPASKRTSSSGRQSSSSENVNIGGEEEPTTNSELVPLRAEPTVTKSGVEGVKLTGESQPLADEYPISERVSDRLNKLSNNLDQYFNDGFIQEIETKAKLNNNSNNNSKDNPKASSSSINSSTSGRKPSKGRGRNVDHDFDVDVGIDGKRDVERDPDETDADDGEDNSDAARGQTRMKRPRNVVAETGRARPSNRPIKVPSGSSRRPMAATGRGSNRGAAKRDKRKTQDKLMASARPADDGSTESSSLRRDVLSRKENLEFENSQRALPNLDPVENETLETPIGPDGDSNIEPDLKAADKKKVDSQQRNVSMRYGKKEAGKFYEEPDWKR